jgi:peptidoglycan/xylan/chitin deacetylase (PgdA/CDA1 family)
MRGAMLRGMAVPVVPSLLWLALAAGGEPWGPPSQGAQCMAAGELAEASFPPTALTHGPRHGAARIALTFDACPRSRGPGYDPSILATLEAEGVPATFFVSGAWAEAHPDSLRALAASPLVELANHAWHHPHMTREQSDAQLADELLWTQARLHEVTRLWPRWFRAPYGELDARVASLVGRAGLTAVQFDIASGDSRFGAERLTRGVLALARPGSIVVLHANNPRFCTGRALPRILSGLRARGFTFTTVGELLAPAGESQACEDTALGFQKMTSVTPGRAKPGSRPVSRYP